MLPTTRHQWLQLRHTQFPSFWKRQIHPSSFHLSGYVDAPSPTSDVPDPDNLHIHVLVKLYFVVTKLPTHDARLQVARLQVPQRTSRSRYPDVGWMGLFVARYKIIHSV